MVLVRMGRTYKFFGLISFLALITTSLAQWSFDEDKCRTPENIAGECKIITDCDSLYRILKKNPYTNQDADYLRRSQCGFEGTLPKVCCPPQNQPPVAPTTERQNTASVGTKPIESNLLPSIQTCGVDYTDRIYGGNETALREFPWMVLVEYEKDNGKHGFYCGGVLISKRYVLTAAHCVKGKDLPKSWKLVGVRLGEHNTETEIDCDYSRCSPAPDCEDRVCAPPPVNVAVEERIAHEKYDAYDPNQYHDIAILRLSRDVTFSDYIQPICLPRTTFDISQNYTGKTVTVAGWGKTETRSESNVKLKLKVPVKTNSECTKTYRQAGVQINNGQICAGGEKGKDSCRGDSGGPLMSFGFDENGELSWYVIGVVSFGPSPCGMENWPGVYTKVGNYASWIVSKMKP